MAKLKTTSASEARITDFISLLWPRLMSISTAARYLDCTPWHIEELCRSGAVSAFKENGQSYSIDRHELDRYADRRVTERLKQTKYGHKALGAKSTELGDAPFSGKLGSPYMTRREAAEYLRSAKWFVDEKIRTGELPFIKAGKKFILAVSDLDDLYQRMRR